MGVTKMVSQGSSSCTGKAGRNFSVFRPPPQEDVIGATLSNPAYEKRGLKNYHSRGEESVNKVGVNTFS